MSRAVLDLAHLERQTFDDRALEREVLTLFERQCARLLPILAGSDVGQERTDAAHTLRGAAVAVGAFRVAALAGAIEAALDEGRRPETVARLLRGLSNAVADASSAIALRR